MGRATALPSLNRPSHHHCAFLPYVHPCGRRVSGVARRGAQAGTGVGVLRMGLDGIHFDCGNNHRYNRPDGQDVRQATQLPDKERLGKLRPDDIRRYMYDDEEIYDDETDE